MYSETATKERVVLPFLLALGQQCRTQSALPCFMRMLLCTMAVRTICCTRLDIDPEMIGTEQKKAGDTLRQVRA